MLSRFLKWGVNLHPLKFTGLIIGLFVFGVALANLTSHTETLVDSLLLAIDSDADGSISDESWYTTFNSKQDALTNEDSLYSSLSDVSQFYEPGDTLQTGSDTSLPGTCTTGEIYIDTDADTNGSLYICISSDTWKEVDDDGAAGGAPTDAQYWTGAADGTLSAEVVVDSAASLETAANLGAYASDILSCTNEAALALLLPSYIDQDVTSGSSPTLDGTNFTGIPFAGLSDNANIGRLDQAETIAANWDNTGNPWAENEIVSTVVVESDVDDTPANGATTDPVSSNWAYDHAAALNPHTATGVYNCTALTGGAAGALDSFADATLVDNDLAICRTGTQVVYMYLFDASATTAESSPTVIRPDDYDTGVWELFAYWADGVLQLVSIAEALPRADGDGTGSWTPSGNATDDRTINYIDADSRQIAATEVNTSGQVNHVVLDDETSIEYFADADGMDDDEYNGDLITGRNCGENLSQWDLVFLNNDADPWHQADADAAGEFPAIGMSIAACTDTNEAQILVRGIVRNEGWTGLTIGGAVYLSDTTGGVTQTAPSTSGDCVQIVGWALSDSEIYFDFSRPYQEVE